MRRSVGVLGGDRRQAELARLLAADGWEICTYGLERWKAPNQTTLEQAVRAEVVVLPLPLCRGDGVLNCEDAPLPTAELFRRLVPGQCVLAGQIKPEQMKEAAACGLRLTDYFLREELTVANAAATAEGAIRVAMEQLDRTLLGMKCLVVGFGRIGKFLSCRLHGLGAQVAAAARRPEDLAWIRAYGWQAENTYELSDRVGDVDVVFNTVPAMIFHAGLLKQLRRDCLCVDLASVRGINQTAAEQMGLPYVWARSLPGRLVPQTAAAIIRDAVCCIINEERGEPA